MNSRKLRPTQANSPTYCALVPGQHVVCINDRWLPQLARIAVVLPKKNVVYTVREVVSLTGGIGVRLKEVRNTAIPSFFDGLQEPAFSALAFRPLPRLKVEDFASSDAWWRRDQRTPA